MSTSRATRKFFLCTGQCVRADQLGNYPQSHVIGELHYVLDEGLRVTALAVYEVSLPSSLIPSVNAQIRVEIIGDARKIRCTFAGCYNFKRWEVARSTLVQRYERAML